MVFLKLRLLLFKIMDLKKQNAQLKKGSSILTRQKTIGKKEESFY